MTKVHFSYTNEFGNTTKMTQSGKYEDLVTDHTEMGFLLDEFKKFLIACGFASQRVEQIDLVDDSFSID